MATPFDPGIFRGKSFQVRNKAKEALLPPTGPGEVDALLTSTPSRTLGSEAEETEGELLDRLDKMIAEISNATSLRKNILDMRRMRLEREAGI
jgi:hypothetical protein